MSLLLRARPTGRLRSGSANSLGSADSGRPRASSLDSSLLGIVPPDGFGAHQRGGMFASASHLDARTASLDTASSTSLESLLASGSHSQLESLLSQGMDAVPPLSAAAPVVGSGRSGRCGGAMRAEVRCAFGLCLTALSSLLRHALDLPDGWQLLPLVHSLLDSRGAAPSLTSHVLLLVSCRVLGALEQPLLEGNLPPTGPPPPPGTLPPHGARRHRHRRSPHHQPH